jgi:hypothetical protein
MQINVRNDEPKESARMLTIDELLILIGNREHFMIYRGPGFLAVV